MSEANGHGRATRESTSSLDALFWRDEILQLLFWLQGEGLGERVSAAELNVFLQADPDAIASHLDDAVANGLLMRDTSYSGDKATARYSLSDMGRREGGRRFAVEFAEMQKSGHGECSADCSCHQTGDHSSCPTHGHRHA